MFELNSNRDLERALRDLSPAPAALDRDRLMFRAGQVAGPRARVFWPAATAVLAFAVVIMGVLLMGSWRFESMARVRPQATILPPQAIQQQRRVAPPAPPPEPAPSVPESTPETTAAASEEDELSTIPYFRLQNQVTRWGLDAIPVPPRETKAPREVPPIKLGRAADPSNPSPGVAGLLWLFQ